MRFAVRRPGIPEASPRGHGVPRGDVPSRVHVSIAFKTAGSAHEPGLALARRPVHMRASRAALVGVAPVGLADAKTRIVPLSEGFDLHGFNLRRCPNGKLLSKPSAKAIERDAQPGDGQRYPFPAFRAAPRPGQLPLQARQPSLANTYDVSGEVKRRCLPGPESGVSTPRS